MRIRFILLVLLCPALILSQEEKKQNPNVELPDFVITGQDLLSIQKTKKIEPELVPSVSEKFLNPEYSPEELDLKDFSNPLKQNLHLRDSMNYYNGSLLINMGLYRLPEAKISQSHAFSNGILRASLSALNKRAHVKYSDIYSFRGAADLSLFVDNEASFLAGTNFKLGGDFGYTSYRFYGSANPSVKRTINGGEFGLRITNLLNKNFIFAAEFTDDIISLRDENFSENLFEIESTSRLQFETFNLSAALRYKNQLLSNNIVNKKNFHFFSIRPAVGIDLSNVLRVSFGLSFAFAEGGSTASLPYGALAFKINKSFTFFGAYNPEPELITSGSLLGVNKYFDVQSFNNLFVKNSSSLSLSMKYEYQTYFEINGGFRFSSNPKLPFYADNFNTGKFTAGFSDATVLGIFLNTLFHLGPYGTFYASAELKETKDDSTKNFVPYYPRLNADLVYSYPLTDKLDAEVNLAYRSDVYSDIQNTTKIPSYIDLGLMMQYSFLDNFILSLELTNLIGKKNYIWKEYEELPRSFSAGLKYLW